MVLKEKYKKIIVMLIVAVGLLGLTIGLKKVSDKKNRAFVNMDGGATVSEEHFGTVMVITLYGNKTKELNDTIAECFKEVSRLERIFSAKLLDSELSDINRNAFQGEVKLSDEMYDLLKEGIQYCENSDGAFDISIGNIVDMWGIGTDHEMIPKDELLSQYTDVRGYQYIVLDESKKSIRFLDPRVKLDLGAIAKGYAADRVKELVKEKQPSCYGMLNFGGNIMTIGSKSGKPWVIGITDPFHPTNVYATVKVTDKCVVTSGNYERYFEKDGVRYHHILDGATGYPASSGIVSTTIIGSNSSVCDALSTATYVLGVEKAIELVESVDGVEAVFISEDGKVNVTSGMVRYGFNVI